MRIWQAFLKEESPMRRRLLVKGWREVKDALYHVFEAVKAAKGAKCDAASGGADRHQGRLQPMQLCKNSWYGACYYVINI